MSLPMPNLGYGPGKSYNSKPGNCKLPDEAGHTDGVIVDNPVSGHIEFDDGSFVSSNQKSKKRDRSDDEAEDLNDDDGNCDGSGEKVADHKPKKELKATHVFKCGMPSIQMQGHTGFLTFATLYPS